MSIGTCRWIREVEDGIVQFAHTAAVTAWKPINKTNIGVCIPVISADANPTTPTSFKTEGIFRFAINTAITVAADDPVYYDTDVDKVVKIKPTHGFGLGVAVEDGTATAGFVDVRINSHNPSMA